jgi:protein SCO1/2
MNGKSLVVSALGLALAGWCGLPAAQAHEEHPPTSFEMLTRTVMPIENSAPLDAESLVAMDGKPASAQLLRGHWSLLYFGYTSCQDVCPTTLQALGRVARDPASGVADGRTSIFFVSVDSVRDTPARLRSYLSAFDAHIVGLGGERGAVRKFTAAAGAGFTANDEGTYHSTSVFVLDASGRPVAVLLNPSNPKRIVVDLGQIRASHDPTLAQRR